MMEKKNAITNVGNVRAGSVYNIFSRKPIKTMADAKGLIDRVAQMAPLVRCWQSYGAKPTSMDWGEIYTSLQTGVLDSVDNPILDMYDEKFYEPIKYVNMTNHLYNMISYNTSMAFWSKLTDKEKAAFKKATKIASEKSAAEVKKRLGGVIADLKKRGKIFVETDTSDFKKAIRDNIDTILAGNKDAIDVYWKIMKKQY
jgi:TRAP-type C4-dicarboxylate transport system substrate-binding protein